MRTGQCSPRRAGRGSPRRVLLPVGSRPGLVLGPAVSEETGQGLLGETGFHEALDYAPARLPQGERQAVVRAQLARHQAMTLLALARHLQGQPMQRRFMREPMFSAYDLLLRERVPETRPRLPAASRAARTRPGE